MNTLKIVIPLTILLIANSCNKSYLDKRPLGQLDEESIANRRGVQGLLIGAYSMLDGVSSTDGSSSSAGSNWIYGSICGSEAHKGSFAGDVGSIEYIEQFKSTATLPDFADKWKVVYDGIQRANAVLRIMRKAKDLNTSDTVEFKAEALFLRAWYHFEAKKMWNKIPFVDETVTYEANNYHIKNDTSWAPIENDLLYAVNTLPSTQPATGRVNKWAAKAVLAKVYLFEKKFSEALVLLQDIIDNGVTSLGVKYDLLKNYSDNFNAEKENEDNESVFAAQSSVNDGSYGANGNSGDVLNFPTGSSGECCGFFQPSHYLANHFKTDASTGLPDLDHFNDDNLKNDQGIESSEPSFTPYDGTLDPRIDWTIGRRGIPYLDWGIHPGKDWTRQQDYYGPYSPKKNVFYRSQIGRLTDAQSWSNGFTAININLIRFADILLWAAEAEIEVGDINKAREYVNRIRRRAADPTGWVHTYIDPVNPSLGFTNTPAANYYIQEYTTSWTDKEYARKAVRFERMLELGMEGQRFFDLVRWGIADKEINDYLKKEGESILYLKNIQFGKGCNEYFPIPQTQIDLSAGADGKRQMTQSMPCYQ